MSVEFATACDHVEAIRYAGAGGRLVLSRLGRGESPVYCATPAIKFVLDGEERYEVDGVRHVVLAGQFLVVEAGATLRAVLPQRAITTGLCFYLKRGDDLPHVSFATAAERLSDDARIRRAVVLSSSGTALGRHLHAVGQAVVAASEATAPQADAAITAASRLLRPLLAEIGGRLDGMAASKGRTRRDLLCRLDTVRSHLHDHDDRVVQLDELARLAGLSQFHLLRSFAAAFGTTPIAYHRDVRLAKAVAELDRDALGVAEAAHRFGFSDERSFRRAYRRRYGPQPPHPGRETAST